jgi:hypothetical protein
MKISSRGETTGSPSRTVGAGGACRVPPAERQSTRRREARHVVLKTRKPRSTNCNAGAVCSIIGPAGPADAADLRLTGLGGRRLRGLGGRGRGRGSLGRSRCLGSRRRRRGSGGCRCRSRRGWLRGGWSDVCRVHRPLTRLRHARYIFLKTGKRGSAAGRNASAVLLIIGPAGLTDCIDLRLGRLLGEEGPARTDHYDDDRADAPKVGPGESSIAKEGHRMILRVRKASRIRCCPRSQKPKLFADDTCEQSGVESVADTSYRKNR